MNELTERIRGATTFTTDVTETQNGIWRERRRRVQGNLVLSERVDIVADRFNVQTDIAAKKIIMLRIKYALYNEVVNSLINIRYALEDSNVGAADTLVQELIRYIDEIKYTEE